MNSLQYFPPAFLATQDEAVLSDNVTLESQPGGLIATGNKNCFIFSSEEIGTALNTVSQMSIDGDIFEGDFIELASQEMSIRITAKDVPSLLEFQTTASAGSAQAVAEDVARSLNDAVIFNRFYVADAFQGGGLIRVTAKVAGSRFILVQNHSGASSAVSTVLGIDGTRGQQQNNYGVYVQIFTGGGDNYGFPVDKTNMQLIGTIEKKYQPDNSMEVDVAGLLDNEPPFIPLIDQFPDLNFIPLYPYLVLWGETFSQGDTFRRQFLVGTSEVKWGLKSALNIPTYTDAVFTGLTIEAGTSNIRFLSAQNQVKSITRNAKEYLSNLFKASPADDTRVAVYTIIPTFRDGTTGAEEIITFQPIPKGGIYTFNASPENLNLSGIEATAGKKILEYRIQIRYATTLAQLLGPLAGVPLATVPQRYRLLFRCYDESINVVFMNQYGCWDGLELNGENSRALEREASTFVKSIPCSPERPDFIRGQKNIKTEINIKAFTTWISQRDATWLSELAKSPRVYTFEQGTGLNAVYVRRINILQDKENEKFFAEVDLIRSAPRNPIKI